MGMITRERTGAGAIAFGSLAALAVVLIVAGTARAATFVVTSNADSGPGTLREAVVQANGNAQADRITFDLPEGQRTITLTSGQLTFTDTFETEVDGGGLVTVYGNRADRVVEVRPGAALTLRALTMSRGLHYGGGGILNDGGTLTVEGSTVSDNGVINAGGGILNVRGTLNLEDSTVRGNVASSGNGGGIYNTGGTVTITGSTVSANAATRLSVGGSLEGGLGGGIVNTAGGTLGVENSTISGNDADYLGGGVYNNSGGGSATLRLATVTANSAPEGQGAGIASAGSATTSTVVDASVVAANEGSDVDLVDGGVGSFLSGGYNVIGDGNATAAFSAPGDVTGVSDPGLGPLADNGGPTQTHALLSGSPAIDRVEVGCPPPTEDQRGSSRPKDGDEGGDAYCDSGAFEARAERDPRPDPEPPPPPGPKECTIEGTRGSDTLVGTDRDDVICGYGGSDVLMGRGGGDEVRGGAGEDSITGGEGPDDLSGGSGSDSLNARDGVRGNDSVDGGPGNDDCTTDRRDERRSC